ncbi:hypothetical protein OG900_06025 [Streptomyces sp. NBC_00433]
MSSDQGADDFVERLGLAGLVVKAGATADQSTAEDSGGTSGVRVTAELQPPVRALADPKTNSQIAAEPTTVLGTESLGLSGSGELCGAG